MKKTEKVNYINNLKKDLEANNALMVYHYIGLNVKQLDELRNKMREAGALVKVTKNRITKLALKIHRIHKPTIYLKVLQLLHCQKIQYQ